MKRNIFFIIVVLAALSACNKKEPDVKAQSAQATQAIFIENATYTQGDLDLINNIKEGNVRRVKALLAAGTGTPYSTVENQTGLQLAAALNNPEIVKALLDKTETGDEKVLDRGDTEGKTAMIYAAEVGSAEIITLLRKKGANPNILDSKRDFPLLIAARNNKLDAVEALLEKLGDRTPANPKLQNDSGENAVLAAARNGNQDMLKLLKDYGANFNLSNAEGTTPLIYAVSKNDKELFDYLLSLGADINQIGPVEKTPLIYAIELKNYDFIKHILDKGAEPNIHTQALSTPLQLLVSSDNADAAAVDYMLAKGAKISGADMPLGNVIGKAIHKGNAAAIKKLIAKGAKVSDLETPVSNGLLRGLEIEDQDIALLMVQNGADVNKSDESGFSPMALAAKKKYKDVFKAIVAKGADVNQSSRNKSAIPIEIVIDSNDAELLQMMFENGLKASPDAILLRAVAAKADNLIPVLLKNKARPNIMNTTGQPILWLAVAKDDEMAVKMLVEGGALVDVQDSDKGLSPLSLAIARGNIKIAEYLLEKNANPDLVDNNGFSALAYAAAAGHVEIVKSLIAHKAEVNAVDRNGNTILKLVDLAKMPKDRKEEIKKILTAAGAQ